MFSAFRNFNSFPKVNEDKLYGSYGIHFLWSYAKYSFTCDCRCVQSWKAVSVSVTSVTMGFVCRSGEAVLMNMNLLHKNINKKMHKSVTFLEGGIRYGN